MFSIVKHLRIMISDNELNKLLAHVLQCTTINWLNIKQDILKGTMYHYKLHILGRVGLLACASAWLMPPVCGYPLSIILASGI